MVSLPPTKILTVEELQTSLGLTTGKNYSFNDGSKQSAQWQAAKSVFSP